MHPAFSVIFFTVASGAGYGLYALLALLDTFGIGGGVQHEMLWVGGIIALGLVTLGLLSSTLHLANPKNAWRAFSRFKTSWLSREGVFAVLFYPFAVIYLGGTWWLGESNGVLQIVGMIGVLLALVTIYSTGMIYASLKTIRQWNTSLTPLNYLLIGFALGSLLLVLLANLYQHSNSLIAPISIALLVLAAIAKLIYYIWIGQPKGATINTATGFTRAAVKLLDVGHTSGTFLTSEFGYEVSAGKITFLRIMVFVLGFAVPFCLVLGGLGDLAVVAVVSGVVGIVLERWLFFAEARHVVNLYHGRQST